MTLQRTPFYDYHVKHGGKMVDFAGWEMPMLFTSIHQEHKQVRSAAGMFDVSHMGRIEISGRHARKFLERVLTRRISDMAENTCRYSLVCNAQGGTLDDVIVYRFDDYWLLVVNASNRVKILNHFKASINDLVLKIEDKTTDLAMVALQGPKVMEYIGRFSKEVPSLKRYSFCTKNMLILKMHISRTGYTGEDGVEVILNAGMAPMAIKLLLREGGTEEGEEKISVQPCGLGARDTLRMEAGMCLYGHELDETIDPVSAGLNFAVGLNKDQEDLGEKFIGQDALKKIAAEGPQRKLIGLKLDGKRTARQGMEIRSGDKVVGKVTSGCVSPTLEVPIALGYVDAANAEAGKTLQIALGSGQVDAVVTALPFYKRAK